MAVTSPPPIVLALIHALFQLRIKRTVSDERLHISSKNRDLFATIAQSDIELSFTLSKW